jgi:Tfp pilus assembly protein PilV
MIAVLLLSAAALAFVWLWCAAAQHDRDAAVGRWMRGGK